MEEHVDFKNDGVVDDGKEHVDVDEEKEVKEGNKEKEEKERWNTKKDEKEEKYNTEYISLISYITLNCLIICIFNVASLMLQKIYSYIISNNQHIEDHIYKKNYN